MNIPVAFVLKSKRSDTFYKGNNKRFGSKWNEWTASFGNALQFTAWSDANDVLQNLLNSGLIFENEVSICKIRFVIEEV